MEKVGAVVMLAAPIVHAAGQEPRTCMIIEVFWA